MEFTTEFRKARGVFDQTVNVGTFQTVVNIGKILLGSKIQVLTSCRETLAAGVPGEEARPTRSLALQVEQGIHVSRGHAYFFA